MPRNTSITLGDHFEGFIAAKIETGRFSNRSEVIRAALRDMEDRELKIHALRLALIEGEASGDGGLLDFDEIRRKARENAGLVSEDA